MKIRIALLALSLVALFLIGAPDAFAFDTQGLVTGRIYDEMNANDNAMNDFYNMTLGWIRIEFEEWMPDKTMSYTDSRVLAAKAKYQNIIAKAHSRGIKVLGVCSWNSFRTSPENLNAFPDTDSSLEEYKTGVKWHVDNYDIDAIEIWNEPNYKSPSKLYFGDVGGVPRLKRYAKMLIDTYTYIKSYKPSVIIVAPATVNAERGDWIDGAYPGDYKNSIFNSDVMRSYRSANGGKLPLDKISWHAYGTGGPPDSGNFYFGAQNFYQYFDTIMGYKDKDNRPIVGTTDIWFTEYGWDSSGGYVNWQNGNVWVPIGEEEQRIFHEKMIKMMWNRPQIKVPFRYCYRDDEPDGPEHYGLRTNLASGNRCKRVYYPFMSHSNLVGLFTTDGYTEWTVDQIIDEYNAHGGRSYFGVPYRAPGAPWYGDKAHYWGPNNNGIIQNFNYGQLGDCAITLRVGAGTANHLRFGFWSYYLNNGGPYTMGWATSDEYWDNGLAAVVQTFDWPGHLQWRSGQPVTWHPW